MGRKGSDVTAAMRSTVCVPRYGTDGVLQKGDAGFAAEINRLYQTAESQALDSLIPLKAKLRGLHGDEFFSAVTEGMADILGADMSFVMKRILVDETKTAVEMPPLGTYSHEGLWLCLCSVEHFHLLSRIALGLTPGCATVWTHFKHKMRRCFTLLDDLKLTMGSR